MTRETVGVVDFIGGMFWSFLIAWVDGVTPWVGIKAMIEDFQVDMHQRDQEMTVAGITPSSTKVIRRKPFYAAEVVMKNLDLRCKSLLGQKTRPSIWHPHSSSCHLQRTSETSCGRLCTCRKKQLPLLWRSTFYRPILFMARCRRFRGNRLVNICGANFAHPPHCFVPPNQLFQEEYCLSG